MKVIGIVGGMGAGKSTVIAIMNEIQPFSYISADLIGHEILLKGADAYQPIIKAFGKEILDESGEIIRKKLGQAVFGNPEKVALLNTITHPIITTKIKERIAYYQKTAPGQHIILEAALLLESGLVDLTDLVIAVYADKDVRVKRVMARENLDEAHILKRFKAQKEWEELKAAADYVIDNGISLDATTTQIKQLLTLL
ncbi:MAG: dephospho-CoA kinase [Candidatus Cellulosilyticum pullistercoris]|uniref:Dephospho-CoA kinase n=1 Tax=Candidatus Cellulosilyticum pullistercoris TaxID=2838521 RepID=A0A9E2NJP0_9FIRM|nr:dephospho-CoA kinase [Candidatus Cellulosilyticum pullistercoris]